MAPIFFFDFASPNAFMAHRVLPDIERRTGATFAYVPVLLGGLFKLSGNQAPMTAFAGVPLKLAYERRESERFLERHGISTFRMNPHFPLNTLQLMRVATAARMRGALPEVVEALFHFTWEAPRRMDDPEVLRAALEEAGLPAEALMAEAQTAPVKERLLAETQVAHARGVFGIPSFLVGEELFFGKDRLPDVEAEITARLPPG